MVDKLAGIMLGYNIGFNNWIGIIMKRIIGTIVGFIMLAACVYIGVIMIDDGSPPETIKEYIIQAVGILAIMFAIPFAGHISNSISGK